MYRVGERRKSTCTCMSLVRGVIAITLDINYY